MGLKEDAAAAPVPGEAYPDAAAVALDVGKLPDVEYTEPIIDVEQVPAHVAWLRVMRDVKSIRKSATASIRSEKGSYSFNYRGIDMVLNAVGPALRRHGVAVLPVKVESTYNTAGRMRDVQVTVTYRITGPLGDFIEVQSVGEGLDAGERGTPKALTTAYRNMLIVALAIPTEDPKMDPDVMDLRREEPVTADPAKYRDEILNPRTSLLRLRAIRAEIIDHRIAASPVVNEVGDDEALKDLYTRVVQERREAGDE